MTKKILFTAICLLINSISFAAPHVMNYQGDLQGGGGMPITNSGLNMTFRIYDALTGGTLQWTENQTVAVSQGEFNVVLGTVTPLPQSVFDNHDDLWMELQIDTDPPLAPRQRLASAPFALQSDSADNVPWGGVSNIPAGFADGIDDVGITAEVDPTVPPSILDGVDWNELNGIPAGFADNSDDGIIVEVDPSVNALAQAILNCNADEVAQFDGTNWNCANLSVGPFVEVDPQVGDNTLNFVPKWNGSALVTGSIYDDGNIGIGTTSPGQKLSVSGDTTISGDAAVGSATLNPIHPTDTVLQIGSVSSVGSNNVNSIELKSNNYSIVGGHHYITAGVKANWLQIENDALRFYTAPTAPSADALATFTERFTILNNGNVGLGVTNPNSPLQLANGARVTEGGVWTDASSRTAKENISDLNVDEALKALNELEPVKFNYKNQKDEVYVGFIAEDVPELTAMNDRKSLSPMDIVGILTKVVQQQQKEIEELKVRLNQ